MYLLKGRSDLHLLKHPREKNKDKVYFIGKLDCNSIIKNGFSNASKFKLIAETFVKIYNYRKKVDTVLCTVSWIQNYLDI